MARQWRQWPLASWQYLKLTVTIIPSMLIAISIGEGSLRVDAQQLPGSWELLLSNAGIASMHSAVTRFGTVVLLDRTDIGASQISLQPAGKCRNDPTDKVLTHDCTAHSVEFDPVSNSVRPLFIQSDTWCSSGQFLPDGTLLQTGGDFDGFFKIRLFAPCAPPAGTCDWEELNTTQLKAGRWYATNQLLPDGRIIIIGGRQQFTAEFYPAGPDSSLVELPFLEQVQDQQMDNLYPFVHLLPDGNLFIFANTDSILYDYMSESIVRTYPRLDGNPRNYPSAGSSVMLALDAANAFSEAEIVVCGGAQFGAFLTSDVDMPGSGDCGRIMATEEAAAWEKEEMPFLRLMGDMVMLPTGDVLIIDGAQAGSQGFELATDPCLHPVLYQPSAVAGLRFMTLTPSETARMYHSTANLLPDGRVLLAGSNPHYYYNFTGPFPTQLKLEAFSPEYLSAGLANLQPSITEAPDIVEYSADFQVQFTVELPVTGIVEVNLASAPFTTHSFSQGQRLVKLAAATPQPSAAAASPQPQPLSYTTTATAPPSSLVAPPSYYMLFLVNQGVPSVATWVQVVASAS